MPVYNPTVKAYEVKDADGSHLALFYVDYSARPSKRGGAWSTEYRAPRMKDGKMVRPVVVNCCNFGLPDAASSRRCSASTTSRRCSTSSGTA